jgi:hypothetical protein
MFEVEPQHYYPGILTAITGFVETHVHCGCMVLTPRLSLAAMP